MTKKSQFAGGGERYWVKWEIQRACATSLFDISEEIIWVMIMGAGVRKYESTKKRPAS